MNVNYSIFIQNPAGTLAFVSLIVTFISLWIHNRPWLWGTFLALTCIFALTGQLIDFSTCIPLGVLWMGHVMLSTSIQGVIRWILILITTLFSITLFAHLFPGFNNWQLAEHLKMSQNAYPYSLYLNFDKPLVGLFPLALTIPLIQSKMHRNAVLIKTISLTALGIILLSLLALHLNLVAIDFKFPHISVIWLIANLFLVTIPEEAFFRGFIQREINLTIPHRWSGPFSVIITSLLFTLMHIPFVNDIKFLVLTCIASLIYGSMYQITRSIESSICCHYLFNVVHFFCFTYPALAPC